MLKNLLFSLRFRTLLLVFLLILSGSFIFSAKKNVQFHKKILPYAPIEIGSFYYGKDILYYSISNRKLVIFQTHNAFVKEYDIPADVVLIDFGDVNKDKRDDLLMLGADFFAVRIQKDKGIFGTREQVIVDDFFVPASSKRIARHTLGNDIDNDGDYDIVLPKFNALLLYQNKFSHSSYTKIKKGKQKKNIWQKVKKIVAPMQIEIDNTFTKKLNIKSSSTQITTSIPKLSFVDINQDSFTDIYYSNKNIFYYFFTNPKASNKKSKNNIKFYFSNLIVQEYPIPRDNAIFWQHHLKDANNDKLLDIILSVVYLQIPQFYTHTYIYFANNDKKYPHQIVEPPKLLELKATSNTKSEKHQYPDSVLPPFVFSIKNTDFFVSIQIPINTEQAFSVAFQNTLQLDLSLYKRENKKIERMSSTTIPFISNNYKTIPGFIALNKKTRGNPFFAIGLGDKNISIFTLDSKKIMNYKSININGMGKFYQSYKSNNEFLIYYPNLQNNKESFNIYVIQY